MITQAREDTVLKIISGENFTPCGLAEKLGAIVVLESSSYQKGKSRHSLMMVDEAFRVEQTGKKLFLLKNGTAVEQEKMSAFNDILDAADYFSRQHKGLEFPFPAGGIGYLSYEFASNCDSITFSDKKVSENDEIPDAVLLFGHTYIIFDHYTDLIYLLGINYSESEINLEKQISHIEKRIKDLDFNYLVQGDEYYPYEVVHDPPAQNYIERVKEIKEEIRKGNLLQAVLSRKIKIKTDMPPFKAYKKLRSTTPSPYMFYLDFTDFQFFGASPEVHLMVTEGKAVMRPIAGTRRRGASQEEDAALAAELLEDEKESAEHLMLLDLARNDLGRVCAPGTVKVTEARTVEKYSHVMHIVSQVEGEIREGMTGREALRASFPAGTVSGAPKIRAIHTLDRLEDEKRGFYAGIVGYFEPGGNLNTCINIRSALKKGGILTLHAGAGIVHDSVPEREYEETCEKLRALASIIGLEV